MSALNPPVDRVWRGFARIWLWGWLALLGGGGHSQAAGTLPKYYQISTWGTEDGLPDASTTGVAQTDDDFLWVGSFKGLSRFDGLKFIPENPENLNGLLDQGVIALRRGQNGSLWIANQMGAAVRREGRWTRYAAGADWKKRVVRTVVELAGGEVIAGLGDHLMRLHETNMEEIPIPPAATGAGPNTEISCMEDSQGKLWLRTKESLARYDQGQVFPVTDWTNHVENQILGAAPAKNGGLWIASGLVVSATVDHGSIQAGRRGAELHHGRRSGKQLDHRHLRGRGRGGLVLFQWRRPGKIAAQNIFCLRRGGRHLPSHH